MTPTTIEVKETQGRGQAYLSTDRRQPDSAVSTDTSLRVGWFRFQIPVLFKGFSPQPAEYLRPKELRMKWVPKNFPVVQRPGREADHLPPSTE